MRRERAAKGPAAVVGAPLGSAPPPDLVHIRGNVWFQGPSGQAGAKHAWSALRKVTRKQMHTHSPSRCWLQPAADACQNPPSPRLAPARRALLQGNMKGSLGPAQRGSASGSIERKLAVCWKRARPRASRGSAHIKLADKEHTSGSACKWQLLFFLVIVFSPKRTQAKAPDVYHAAGSWSETLFFCPRWPGPQTYTQPKAIKLLQAFLQAHSHSDLQRRKALFHTPNERWAFRTRSSPGPKLAGP